MGKQSNLKKSILIVVLGALAILMVPFVAMQFTSEVDWSIFDFVIMFVLLFSTGLAYVLITQHSSNLVSKAAYGLAIGTTFLMIWANLAVGLIGAGPHWGNFMYAGVIAVAIIGTFLSGFKPQGMERAMYATSFSLVLVAAIALLANMDQYPASSVIEIIGVNGFFAFLYLISGMFFRYIGQMSSTSE